MPRKNSSFFAKVWTFIKTKWGIATIVLILVIIGALVVHARNGGTKYQYVSVKKGSITETVSVSGNTTPVQSVSLSFQNTGTISSVSAAVGDHVSTGQVLARLNASDLVAQLDQAKANVDAEQAKLDGLKAGSRPEDIQTSQAALDKANQDLANLYSSIVTASADAYSKANDAVRSQLQNLFTNSETTNPQLTFQANNSQLSSTVTNKRVAVGDELDAWQSAATSLSTSDSTSTLAASLSDSVSKLQDIGSFLNNVSLALNGATNLDSTTLSGYKANVAAGLSEVNGAATTLTGISHNIASQIQTVAQAQANLNLKLAGSDAQDIEAQQAEVEQAQANVASAQAKLNDSVIVAPIDGVVTQFDAKVGQQASPAASLISIISNNQFEVDAYVPETDIGKISISDDVSMTFDAFSGKTYDGTVFYIDPAQTINQGVVDYKIKVAFKTVDPNMKSGLTSNLEITSTHEDNVLILPQYAIVQNDQGTFVEIVQNNKVVNVPVVLGVQDNSGNVEVKSGVTEGEQVLNIGLKSS